MGSTWTSSVLCALSIVVAAVFTIATVRGRADRSASGAHALMGVGMAAMFSPAGDPVPPAVGAAVFAVVAAWFAARLLRGGPAGAGGAAHLVIAPAAMAVMYLAMGGSGGHSSSMPGMDMGGGSGGGAALGALWLALAGYFVWHTWRCASSAAPLPGVSGPAVAVIARPGVRVERGAHLVMGALMAAMFLFAI